MENKSKFNLFGKSPSYYLGNSKNFSKDKKFIEMYVKLIEFERKLEKIPLKIKYEL